MGFFFFGLTPEGNVDDGGGGMTTLDFFFIVPVATWIKGGITGGGIATFGVFRNRFAMGDEEGDVGCFRLLLLLPVTFVSSHVASSSSPCVDDSASSVSVSNDTHLC